MKHMKQFLSEARKQHDNEDTSLQEARKVNTNRAMNAARKVVDTVDKFESTVVDMQDQDIINSKAAKMFDKAAKQFRAAIGEIEDQIM